MYYTEIFANLFVCTVLMCIWWYIGTLVKYLEDKKAARKLRRYSAKAGKPILNLGCGRTNYGDINADLIRRRNVRNFMRINASKRLPFQDKELAAVFCSNLIEHLPNPKSALAEMKRVADYVYIGRPRWWQLGTWLTPDHRWLIFSGNPSYKFVKYHFLYAYITLSLVLIITWTLLL